MPCGLGPARTPVARRCILTPYIAMSCIRRLANLTLGTFVRRFTSSCSFPWYLLRLLTMSVMLPLTIDPNVLF